MFRSSYLKRYRIFSMFLFLIFILGLIANSPAAYAEYTETVRNVEIQSPDYSQNVPSSWHIDKSAEWVGKGKAKVTFDVTTVSKNNPVENKKDVILVLDISGSMYGRKLDHVQSDAKSLINKLFDDDENKVALVSFSDEGTKLQNFGASKSDLLASVDNLDAGGLTNYYDALLKAEDVLAHDNNGVGYQEQADRDLIILFLTDGYPCMQTNLEVGQYEKLKELYPTMKVVGVQYELGVDIAQEIINISDKQYYANMDNLHNVLFNAVDIYEKYQNFQITDYIDLDCFELESPNDVEVTQGTVDVIANGSGKYYKVVWDLGEDFHTGNDAQMTINLKLKDSLLNSTSNDVRFLPTNTGEDITVNNKQTHSDKTPVLADKYYVHYDSNKPGASHGTETKDEPHIVYDNVAKSWPGGEKCSGYLFKGWKFVTPTPDETKNIFKTNNKFVMPEADVYLNGTWGTVNIKKSMKGDIATQAEPTTAMFTYGQWANAAMKRLAGDGQNANIFTEDRRIQQFAYKQIPGLIGGVQTEDTQKTIIKNATGVTDVENVSWTRADANVYKGRVYMWYEPANSSNGNKNTIYWTSDSETVVMEEGQGDLFEELRALESVYDLDKLDFSSVKYMEYMFMNCTNLQTLDLSSLNTANVLNMNSMFYGCSNLRTIYASDSFVTTGLIYADDENGINLFTGCTSLVGGAGTRYNSSYTNHAYAHIDGGTSNPGYFTAKPQP